MESINYLIARETPDQPPHEVNYDTLRGQRDGYSVQRDAFKKLLQEWMNQSYLWTSGSITSRHDMMLRDLKQRTDDVLKRLVWPVDKAR